MVKDFLRRGWARFPYAPEVAEWAAHARAAALEWIADPVHRAEWLQCGGTWFVGVDTLPNGPDGAVAGSSPLSGPAHAVACGLYGALPLHRAQVSVVYPGYPRPRDGEGDAAFRYRLTRDAAHVDGLHAIGAARARMLRERHAYILGLPLIEAGAEASPLVVWDGSHERMRAAFMRALDGVPPGTWGEIDLTEVYKRARREVFETCARVELPAKPGEATLVHRLALHGVAPWVRAASDAERMIAYFRPELVGAGDEWLTMP